MKHEEGVPLGEGPHRTSDHLIEAQSTGWVGHHGVPGYGTPDFYTLPLDDPRRPIAQIHYDAACWRKLAESEYLAEVVHEWILWNQRRAWSEASTEISKCAKERADKGWRWTPYSELERRRRLVSVETCALCGKDVELVHPWPEGWIERCPDLSWVRCPGCASVREPA